MEEPHQFWSEPRQDDLNTFPSLVFPADVSGCLRQRGGAERFEAALSKVAPNYLKISRWRARK